jgi:hypothetical protein
MAATTTPATSPQGKALTTEERLAREPILRLDTRTIVGSLLLAVAFAATMQITERIDQIWTGGIAVPLGHTFAQVWWPVTVIYFGLTGAIIVAVFNPILAVLSATHPLAWSFFFLNLAETVPLAYMFRWYFQNRGPLTFVPFIVIVAIGDFLANFVQALALSMGVLQLPLMGFPSVIALFLWQWGMAVIIGGTIGWYVYKAFSRAGVFG